MPTVAAPAGLQKGPTVTGATPLHWLVQTCVIFGAPGLLLNVFRVLSTSAEPYHETSCWKFDAVVTSNFVDWGTLAVTATVTAASELRTRLRLATPDPVLVGSGFR